MKSQTAMWVVTAGALVTTGAAITATQFINTANGTSGGTATAAAKETPKATKTPTAEPPGKNLNLGSVVVTGLSPGVSVLKQLSIANPNNQDVDLQTVKTTIGGPTPSGACSSPADIEVIVAGYNASTGAGPIVTIPKNSSVNLPVTVRMNNTAYNQNGCKGRTFNFVFTAAANSK